MVLVHMRKLRGRADEEKKGTKLSVGEGPKKTGVLHAPNAGVDSLTIVPLGWCLWAGLVDKVV